MDNKEILYDITVTDASGENVSLSEYEGKVLLIVNTATGCGFTPQYAGLQELYATYRDQGFEILDFPCNQFLGQAPGTIGQICEFVATHYSVTFRTFDKIHVNGKKTDPLFRFLKSQKKGSIKWNFTKFLIDRNGKVVERFEPAVTPEEIEPKIKELLG